MDLRIFASLLLASYVGCSGSFYNATEPHEVNVCECGPFASTLTDNQASIPAMDSTFTEVRGALLASRFKSLEEFKSVVQVEYFGDTTGTDSGGHGNSGVRLKYCGNGQEVFSVLKSGINQGDIEKIRKGDFWDRLGLIHSSPYAVANRMDLVKVYNFAKWRPDLFGEGDIAFFDLAKTSATKINTKDLAYRNARDSSEKGYINSFNHIIAQAFITSCFSEELADFVADVHERHYMPELTTGKFTEDQLKDPENNPVDNYVDLINNEWGQEIGKQLRKKYHISRKTYWTPKLLANYLNDLQSYYGWAFQIGIQPFRPEDEVIIRFSNKINVVMAGGAN